MQFIIRSAALLLLLTLYSNSALAAKEDCEVLKAPGTTKGLYGLCIAYWASGGNENVLKNYDKKKGPDDPDMPGLGGSSNLLCPCWDQLTDETAGTVGGPVFCLAPAAPNDFIKAITYGNGTEQESFAVFPGSSECLYSNDVTGEGGSFVGMSSEDYGNCLVELEALALTDFGDFINGTTCAFE